jgi:hypothetical protein
VFVIGWFGELIWMLLTAAEEEEGEEDEDEEGAEEAEEIEDEDEEVTFLLGVGVAFPGSEGT